ncbi:MAG: hypothetical protein QOH88_955 [Verrucomicrobiota bacterium]
MTNRIAFKLALLAINALAAISLDAKHAAAAEISGVKLPDQVTLEGKTLKLNGAGLRQATILRFNVYAAGLYLENSSSDGESIANSEQLKSIELVFMRDVSASQMAEAFQEGFEKNCIADCGRFKGDIGKLQGLMKDLKKGDSMAFHFSSGGVTVMIRGQKMGTVGDKAFGQQLIRCWIGKNPPNAGLKDGMLSGKK